jgi:hypothetical protein
VLNALKFLKKKRRRERDEQHPSEANERLLLQHFSTFTAENGLWFKEQEEDERRPFKQRCFEIRGGHFAF